MADVAISGLTALGAAPATNDLLVLVDVSDTTQAPTGTTKKMTTANLFTSPHMTGAVVDSGGLTVTAGGLTVTAGTTAVQALTAAGLVTASAGVLINGGSGAAGTFYKSAANGLTLQGATGSVADFDIANAAGSTTAYIPTGTSNFVFLGGVDFQGGAGFGIGSVGNTGRRRIQSTGVSGFNMLGDDNGFAALEIAGLTTNGVSTLKGGVTITTGGFAVTGGTTITGTLGVSSTLQVSGASTFTVTGAVPVALNRGDSAAIQGMLSIGRVGTVKGYIGLDASDNIILLNAAATTANLTITDAGAVTVRSTLGVSSDFAVATSKFTVAAASGNTAVAGTLGVTGAITGTTTVGVGGGRADFRNNATVPVSTSATTILASASANGSLALVCGISGGDQFFDIVFFGANVAAKVSAATGTGAAQIDISGTPALRTYTCVSGNLRLAMASGTYSVSATEIRMGNTGA